MSAFKEAVEARLVCPDCTAMNRPGATYIEVSADFRTAYCSVCSKSRPIAEYQPPQEQRPA